MRVIPRDQISMVLQAPTIIAGGFPRNHQNGRTYGTTTYTAREIISVFSTGSEVTSFVFCSVHKGKTWGVLGSEVRVGGKTHKFGSCSCVVKPWPTGKTCMIHVKVNTNTTFQRTFSEKKRAIVRDLPEYTSSVLFPGHSFRPHRTNVAPAVDNVKPIHDYKFIN